jgi:hypothetical protein
LGFRDFLAQIDLNDLPDSCKKEEIQHTNPPMVTKRLASVVTRLWFQSPCDRDLVAMAAAKLVEGHKDEILKFSQQPLP